MSDWVDLVNERHVLEAYMGDSILTVHAYNVDGGTFCDISTADGNAASSTQLTMGDMVWLRDMLDRAISLSWRDRGVRTG